jgi:SAM-dependent methyltransferase
VGHVTFRGRRAPLAAGLALALASAGSARSAAAATPADTSGAIRQLRAEADALRPLFPSALVRVFLAATADLPAASPRVVLCDSSRTHYWSAAAARALPDSVRARLISRTLGESFYYNTRYGSPLAYARPLEILASAGLDSIAGLRVMDFGCGTLGHLRLLASLGADAIGIDVDPLLAALYSEPGDRGAIRGSRRAGRLRLAVGRWPGEPALRGEAGGGYDVFVSKNTLKRGYLHPERPADPRQLVQLGVDDTTFVRAVHEILKPRGLALIYNLCPAPAPPDKPYIPWADGRSPFPRELLEREGFEVLAFDRDDSAEARRMAHALGWDAPGGMDLERDLFATYTLLRRRG